MITGYKVTGRDNFTKDLVRYYFYKGEAVKTPADAMRKAILKFLCIGTLTIEKVEAFEESADGTVTIIG